MNDETCKFYDVGCQATWMWGQIELFFVHVVESILQGLVSIISLIPVPDFMTNLQSFSLPGDVLFYTTLFEVPAGLGMIVSAYTLRFILRRIPGIG